MSHPLFFDLTTLLTAFAIALAIIAIFRKLRAIKNLAWFLLGLIAAYVLFFTGLGDVVVEWLRELITGQASRALHLIEWSRELISVSAAILALSIRPTDMLVECEDEEDPNEEPPEPEEFLLTFGIGPVLIFAILAGIALMVSLPLFFAQAGGGASEALEAFGEAFGDTLRLVASELGFIAVYLMPALIAILPIYVLRHKEKLTFIAFGCIYGLLLTYILFQIGFIDVMVQTFTSLYGSWASVPATVTTNVLSGFVLRMIDEWIANLKKPARKVRRRVKR